MKEWKNAIDLVCLPKRAVIEEECRMHEIRNHESLD